MRTKNCNGDLVGDGCNGTLKLMLMVEMKVMVLMSMVMAIRLVGMAMATMAIMAMAMIAMAMVAMVAIVAMVVNLVGGKPEQMSSRPDWGAACLLNLLICNLFNF